MYAQPYFDYNATTPLDQQVLEAMLPYFGQDFGNASSAHHTYGWMAKHAVEDALRSMAQDLGVPPEDLVVTSGATESIAMIIKGVAKKMRQKGKHIITTKVEHKAVLDTCAQLEMEGFEVSYLDVDHHGLISPQMLEKNIRPDTVLVAVIHANNETGALQPLDAIAERTRKHGILLFSDTTQALGKVDLTEVLQQVDYACFSAHKVYGPKGIGLAYIRNNQDRTRLPSLIPGGGQQKSQRGGTLNTPFIVGFAKAIDLAFRQIIKENQRIETLRNVLETELLKIPLAVSNSTAPNRLPNTLNISFPYVDGDTLMAALSHKIALSNGSACTSAAIAPSHVLTAMGVAPNLAQSSLRLSLGRFTTRKEVDRAIAIITEEIAVQRQNNILWERRG